MAARHVPKLGGWDNRDPVPALSPPRNLYRDLIRNVAVSRGQYIRLPVHTGSAYSNSSGGSSSYYSQTNSSDDCSSGSASVAAATAEFCAHDHDLAWIARRMVHDGYAERMVNAFGTGALEAWFLELDVDWVLQPHEGRQEKSASSLQELTDRWIRALIVITVSMAELVLVVNADETPAVARFGKASMAKMLVFVDAIIAAPRGEKLRALVDMYVCISTASYRFASYRFAPLPIYPEAQTMLNDIGRSLSREVIRLREAISSTMEQVRKFFEDDDDSWATLIPRGRGEVHRNTLLMVNCITSMVKVEGLIRNTAQGHDTTSLGGLIDASVLHLKDLLLRKSELCSDQSLRYLFLLNNFCSVAQLPQPRPGDQWVHTPECKLFMDSYLDVSWGHVLSHIRKTVFKDSCLDVSCEHVLLCIPRTGFHEWRQHRKKISSLATFESAFHKTYQAQKFWKVPDPPLRNALRSIIIERVTSDYRCYLKKHPEVEKHASSSPDVFKEMLGELFEG